MTPAVFTPKAAHPAVSGQDRTFPGLDLLRGWGAIAVVVFHCSAMFSVPVLRSCHLAVDMFFTMSGFIIAHAYDDRVPRLGILGFIRLRAIRFYPLLFLGLAVGALRCMILIPYSHASYNASRVVWAFVLNIVYLPAPPGLLSSTEISPLDGPAWTLMFEMAVNVAYVVLFRWLSTRVLIAMVAVALAGLAPAILFYDGVNPGPHWDGYGGGAARVCFSFTLGVLIYRLGPPRVKLGFMVLPGLLALLCLGGRPWVDLLLTIFGSPLLVIVASNATPRWGGLAAYLGAISYCIYAIHAPILMLVYGFSHRFGVFEFWPILGAVAALLVVCPMLDRWYDQPLRRWLGNYSRSRFSAGATP